MTTESVKGLDIEKIEFLEERGAINQYDIFSTTLDFILYSSYIAYEIVRPPLHSRLPPYTSFLNFRKFIKRVD